MAHYLGTPKAQLRTELPAAAVFPRLENAGIDRQTTPNIAMPIRNPTATWGAVRVEPDSASDDSHNQPGTGEKDDGTEPFSLLGGNDQRDCTAGQGAKAGVTLGQRGRVPPRDKS
jgi:hypothetical protein